MKKNIFIIVLAVAMSSLAATLLSSCTDTEQYVAESNAPIDLQVILSLDDIDLPEDALSSTSPVKVIGLRQECQQYSKVFEEEAYVDSNGHIVFINRPHYWLSDRLMTFTVYWPADAHVTTDNYGRIISGDCIIVGRSVPFNPILPKTDNSMSDDRFVLRAFK